MPTVSMSQVIKRVDQGQIHPIYVFFGPETFLLREYLDAMCDRILKDTPRDFNHDVFHIDNDGLAEALGQARTWPMMAAHRVVVVHGLQHLRKADFKPLEQYADAPTDTTALMCSTSQDVAKLPAALRDNAVAVACKRLEGSQLRQWVTRTATQRQAQITDEAVRGLLDEQDNDLQMLSHELDKLSTYVGEEGEITLETVQAVSEASRHQSIFALSDALGARQVPEALKLIDRLLQQGEPALVILSMMIRHVRLLWSLKQLGRQRQDLGQVAKTLGLPQGVCRKLATHSRSYSIQRLEQLYSAAVEADLAFKSSNKAPQAILEGFVFALCAKG